MEVDQGGIIFCLGDKEKLEEITGNKYEFIKLDENKRMLSQEWRDNCDGAFLLFIEVFSKSKTSLPVTLEMLLDEMKNQCRAIGADAVIHYYTQLVDNKLYNSYARGVPVRLSRQ